MTYIEKQALAGLAWDVLAILGNFLTLPLLFS
jgi:hypothetical protein